MSIFSLVRVASGPSRTPRPGWIFGPAAGRVTERCCSRVKPNTSSSPRTGAIAVAGQTVTVTQDANLEDCSYSVTPAVFSFSAASESGKVTVKVVGEGCPWTVASSQSWLVPAVTGGIDTGTFSFTAKQNNGITNRQGTLTVGNWAVTVFQSGKTRRTK